MRAAILAAALLFCAFAYAQSQQSTAPVKKSQGVSQSDGKGHASENQKAEHRNASSNNPPPTINKANGETKAQATQASNKDPDEKLGIDREIAEATRQAAVFTEKLADYTDLLAAYTKWLAIATVVLILVGVAQGYLLWCSVKVAESALIDLERPYVFINFSDYAFSAVTTQGGQKSINFTAATQSILLTFFNRGRSPAIPTELYATFVFPGNGKAPDPIDPRSERGNIISFGYDLSGERPYETMIGFGTEEWVNNSERFVIGYMRYRDIFGKRHITGFCARYDPPSNRFVMHGDEKYCYMKDEKPNTGLSLKS